jgi:hypothetical protein
MNTIAMRAASMRISTTNKMMISGPIICPTLSPFAIDSYSAYDKVATVRQEAIKLSLRLGKSKRLGLEVVHREDEVRR